jgi:hypothetical protein
MIYIKDVEPHFEDNKTHSLVRDFFLVFFLVIGSWS